MSIAIFTLGVRKRSEEQSYHRKLSIFCTLRPLMVNDIHRNTCYYAKKQLFGTTLTMFKDLSLFLFGEKYQYNIRNLFLALENNQIHFDKKLIEMHLKSNKVIWEKSQLSYRNSSMHIFQNLIQTAALANPRNFFLQALL